MKEHAELLSSVRDDISEYKVSLAKSSYLYPNYGNIFFCSFYCYYFLCFVVVFLKVRFVLLSFMQASGSMSPRMQLLRERAAIHGSIAHVSLIATMLSCYRSYALERNLLICFFTTHFSISYDVRNAMFRSLTHSA